MYAKNWDYLLIPSKTLTLYEFRALSYFGFDVQSDYVVSFQIKVLKESYNMELCVKRENLLRLIN